MEAYNNDSGVRHGFGTHVPLRLKYYGNYALVVIR